MFYTLHVVEPLRYDSVLIKETNEWMNEWRNQGDIGACPPVVVRVKNFYMVVQYRVQQNQFLVILVHLRCFVVLYLTSFFVFNTVLF